MAQQKKYASAIILGMHDALVSLTGLLAGLTFALTQKKLIILSAVIASVTAGLSMGASEYLAEKTNHNQYAWRAGIATGIVYMTTCVMLLVPFYILDNSRTALLFSFAIAVLMIFMCNFCIRHAHNYNWWRHAIEMLIICTTVSIIAFCIGEFARLTFDVTL